jgi:hypothetical protein
MKFQYSPGLLGYGSKGSDGSDGLQGLAIYFTDRNPLTDFIAIENLIANDEVLWSTALPGTKLPGGREYLDGDLFIDPRGFVYEITNNLTGEYFKTGMALNKSTIFQSSVPSVETANLFERWFNKDASVIIDNIFTNNTGNYSKSPSKIYGIAPKNFGRIEYTDIHDGSNNAFSVYSSGENTITDDYQSMAIVRDISSNNFRLGNLDGNDLRDVDLFLDVRSLKHFKDTSINTFKKNTPAGTFLTNYEVSTNLLFDPNFTPSPASFSANATSTSVKIDWNLSDFISDPDIKATLYFYRKQDPSGGYNINADIVRPLIFHNINPVASIIITNLTIGLLFEYYISIEKNGWERNSIIKQITTTNIPIYLTVTSPAPAVLTADYTGKFSQNLSKIYHVTLDTNSFTGWRSTDVPVPSWIKLSKTSNPVAGPDAFDVSLLSNTGTVSRSADITLSSEAPNKTISITQNCYQTWVYFDDAGSLNFTPALTDQYANVTVKIFAWVRVQRDYTFGTRRVRAQIDLKQSSSVLGSVSRDETAHNNSKDSSTYSSYTIYPNSSNQYNFNVEDVILECDYDNNGDYEFSQVWAEITNAYISSGTGRLDISTNKIWYAKNPISSSPRCTRTALAAATVPAMGAFV